ncbi:hypothetical protein [Catenulispora rubra]|uniref:hypothetical protein n=1 Tax=Catenulispora rubra TaxID=280293 RepID=UPI00189262DD|nr:hypothetical protein [Catenulispora rubra]
MDDEAVGNFWVGPDPGRASGAAESAWLYDINVFEPHNVVGDNAAATALYRRSGYDVTSMAMRKQM